MEKKRKNVDGKEGSPFKIRSATLQRHASSKLQFVVDIGTSFTKSPSKSTTNALSLHSSVPSHLNNNNNNTPTSSSYMASICNSPGVGVVSSPTAITNVTPSSSKKSTKKQQNNTLHRRSVRISQQLKLDEVTKIYAPLSGSDYLSSPTTPRSPPLFSNNTNHHQYNSNIITPLSINKLSNNNSLNNTPTTTTTSTSLTTSTLNNDNNNGSTSISPLMESLLTSKPKLSSFDDKENNNIIKSPPTSPTRLSTKQPLSPIRLSLNLSAANTNNVSIIKTPRKSISIPLDPKRQTIDNCEFILGKMSEYQKLVLSIPDLFMLSNDILHSEYQYLLKDTKIISKILSPLDNITGSETNTQVIKKNGNFESSELLTEMDIIAQSISSIAKKLLAISSEMKKNDMTEKKASTLSLFVSAVKEYLESGEIVDLPNIPTEVAHSLINSTENTTSLYNPDENGYLYKSGTLVKKCKKGPLVVWKDQWFILTCEKLTIFNNQNATKSKKEILLNNIISIAPCTKYNEHKHCFMIRVKNPNTKIVVSATSERESSLWMLAIDGLPRRNFDTNQSGINVYIRETLLEVIGSSGGVLNYRRSIAGGVVRSSHGEEWTYRADGTLFNTDHLEPSIRAKELKYIWNGQLLVAADDSPRNLGSGKFNGVWIAWYNPSGEPFLKYMWQPETNEYLNQNHKLSHKWSTRGLVSKVGTGEWMIEGNVPTTVVMFLQCLRYYRLGKNF